MYGKLLIIDYKSTFFQGSRVESNVRGWGLLFECARGSTWTQMNQPANVGLAGQTLNFD